jgi:hypothetical protein
VLLLAAAVIRHNFFAQLYKTAEEARDKGMKQAMALLTDEQKGIWKKLTSGTLWNETTPPAWTGSCAALRTTVRFHVCLDYS